MKKHTPHFLLLAIITQIHFKRLCWKFSELSVQYLINIQKHLHFSFHKYGLLLNRANVTRSKQELSQTKNHIRLFILTHSILHFKTHKNTLSYKLQEKFKSTELKRWLKWWTALAAPPQTLGSIPSTPTQKLEVTCNPAPGVLCPLVISEGIRTQVVHRHILRQSPAFKILKPERRQE